MFIFFFKQKIDTTKFIYLFKLSMFENTSIFQYLSVTYLHKREKYIIYYTAKAKIIN